MASTPQEVVDKMAEVLGGHSSDGTSSDDENGNNNSSDNNMNNNLILPTTPTTFHANLISSSDIFASDAKPKNGFHRQRGTTLQEFYYGTNVFITGGTGFLGKLLLFKLLKSCQGIDNIYLLVRTKKGKDVHTRVEEIFDDTIFDTLKEEVPKFRHKIVVVPGDVSFAGLGLSLSDRQMLLDKINVVIHAAATVRFDEKIQLALSINVHGVKSLLDLCKSMTKLKALIHVSTAYSNCQRKDVAEMFYKCPVKVEEVDKLVAKLDDAALDKMMPKILGEWPNTYTFTKALAEDYIRENSKGLPIGIFRPAIVTSTYKEPVVGWIDNLYGPTGVVAGVGTGVLRTMHCHGEMNANIVPVDMCVNALLASAWDVANNCNDRKEDNMLIYNYVSSVENPITWNQFMELNVNYGFKYPFSSAVWYYCITLNKSIAWNKLYIIFLHYLPALLIDGLTICIGQKPRLLKVYKKVHKFADVISYFCTNEWKFTNDNVQGLWTKMENKDKQIFPFSIKELDWFEYLRYYIRGMRLYLFKEESTLAEARRKWRRFRILHGCLKTAIGLSVAYLSWKLVANFVY